MRAMPRDLILIVLNDRRAVGAPRKMPIVQTDPGADCLLGRTGNFFAIQPAPHRAWIDAQQLRCIGR